MVGYDDREASSNDDGGGPGSGWAGNAPKPWWADNPQLKAEIQRVLDEMGLPRSTSTGTTDQLDPAHADPAASSNDDACGADSGVAEQADVGERDLVCDDRGASSNDDACGTESGWAGNGPKPWWADDPELKAIRQRVLDDIAARPYRPPCTKPDPVLQDVLSGGSARELRLARDDLARAQSRYRDAIRSARACGLSWGEIGAVLGVPRQLLHRRYAKDLTATP